MLTPVEVQSKNFVKSGLGYDRKDVESFRADVLHSYEELYRNNMELKDKVNVLSEGIQYYKSIEKTLQKALVLAEKTAEETRNNAALEAKRIEKEALAKANIMVADAKNELNNLHQQTVALVQQYEKYKLQFKNLAQAQMELINSEAFSLDIQKIEAFSEVQKLQDVITPRKKPDISQVIEFSQSEDAEEEDFDAEDFDEASMDFDFMEINETESDNNV